MGLPIHTNTEKPSTSETNDATAQASSTGAQQQVTADAVPGTTAQPKGDAELAAEELYEERIEEEYAKHTLGREWPASIIAGSC